MHESAEMYLETIHVLGLKGNKVRSIDIVNELDFSRPSVSIAMKKLKQSGHIDIDNAGCVALTESGLKIARAIYERHKFLTDFLISMGVDEQTAVKDACRMEHVISQQTFEKIYKYLKLRSKKIKEQSTSHH